MLPKLLLGSCLLALVASPLAHAGKVGFRLDDVSRPKDVAAYFAWVKETIPEFFSNTDTFTVNFWEIIQEQNHLQQWFEHSPEYRDYVANKHNLLRFRITEKNSPPYDVAKFIHDQKSSAYAHLALAQIEQKLAETSKEIGAGSSPRLLGDLKFFIPGPMKGQYKDASIDQILEVLSQNGGIPAKFTGNNYGLTPPYDIATVKAIYLKKVALEGQLVLLRQAQVYKTQEALFAHSDHAEALKYMDSAVPKGPLKDSIIGYKLDSKPAESIVDLELREVPVSLAVWKSIVGVECTPARFANAPSERAFFIYDPRNPKNPKGYLQAALGQDPTGQRVLSIKGIQGPQISPNDLKTILSKAHELAHAMGATRAVLQKEPNANHPGLEQQLEQSSNWDRPVHLTFVDAELRTRFLDPEPNPIWLDVGGIHHSEKYQLMTEAQELINPDPAEAAELETKSTLEPIRAIELPEPDVWARFEAGVAYARYMDKRPQGELANVFGQLGLKHEDMKAFLEVVTRPWMYTEEQFKEQMIATAKTVEGPLPAQEVLGRMSYILKSNSFRFSDSFSAPKEKSSVTLLIKAIREQKDRELWEFKHLTHLSGHPVPLLKSKILELLAKTSKPDDSKVAGIALSLLDPDQHLDPVYADQILGALSRNPLIRDYQAREDQSTASRNLLTETGFYTILNQLYAVRPQEVLALVKEFETRRTFEYFIQLNPEIRSQFPEFRNAVISNLKTPDASRGWLNDMELSELGSKILRGDAKTFAELDPHAKLDILRRTQHACSSAEGAECSEFKKRFAEMMRREHHARNFDELHHQFFEALKRL